MITAAQLDEWESEVAFLTEQARLRTVERDEARAEVEQLRLRLRTALDKEEVYALLAVADAAHKLCDSGYDGPFMGEAVAPLFAALAALDKEKL